MHVWPLWVSWWAIWSTRSAKEEIIVRCMSMPIDFSTIFIVYPLHPEQSFGVFSKSWRVILQFAFCGGLALPFKALPSLHCRNLKCWHGCGHRALRYSQAELFSLEVLLRIWLLAHLRQCLSICERQSMALAPVSKSIRCTWDFQAVGSAIFVYWLFGV